MIGALYDGERRLAQQLLAVAERHAEEHEVHHVARDLAAWSREHAERLVAAAAERDVRLDGAPGIGIRVDLTDAGPPLLRDLCALHLVATQNSLCWEMLAQAARAARDEGLLSLASACHPQTLRQLRWTNTLIKQLSPQELVSRR
ncbi:hypothetical protein ABZ896_47905 [Streptomyces sp. NPDC047072]|uniref:hypothetical protein n=1 Tax=Streptomyces sp. NPDC047072 TaxID=3154809 RepID=UPI0033E692B7